MILRMITLGLLFTSDILVLSSIISIRHTIMKLQVTISPTEAIASSAVKTARDLRAKLIVVLTETGNTSRLISKYRPSVNVLVVTTFPQIARQVQGYMKNTISQVVPSMIGAGVVILFSIIAVQYFL
jgi:pyruvate kinase